MIAALKRKTLFVFDEKRIVSFNFAALTVSFGYELFWCSYFFVISITTALLCSWRCQVYELDIIGTFLFPVIYVHGPVY